MEQPKVEQVSKSNFARRATLAIGKKLITLPTYGVVLYKKMDFNTILEKQLWKKQNFDIVASPIHRLGDIIHDKEQRRHLKNQFGEPVEKEYLELRDKIWFADTFCDGLYYASFEGKLSDYEGYSQEVRQFLRQMNKDNYSLKWKELVDDKRLLMKYLRETIEIQKEARMDFMTNPSPILFKDSPNYMVDITVHLVRSSAILAETIADKPAAIYLTVHSNNFKKPDKLKLLMEKLFDEAIEPHVGKIKFVVLKVIEEETIETDGAGMRLRYKNFLTALSTLCSNSGRALIMLDTNSVGLVSVALGVDGFVEPLNGVTGIGFRKSKDKHGRYYHPDGLKFISYEDIKEIYANKGTLPCHCSPCKQVSVPSLDDLQTNKEWNTLRRAHLVSSRTEEIREYHDAIRQDIVSNAIVDKVQRSDIKNLLDVLPNGS